jgi:hypothetical protein
LQMHERMHVQPLGRATDMNDYGFGDAVLELARRTDLGDALELAPSDEEARVLLEVMDELQAEEKADDIAATLRQQGHTL